MIQRNTKMGGMFLLALKLCIECVASGDYVIELFFGNEF